MGKITGKAKYPCGYEISMEAKSIWPWFKMNINMPSGGCPIHGTNCSSKILDDQSGQENR